MTNWILRTAVVAFFLLLGPVARWAERTLSHTFGTGDGEISRFGINHAIDALPVLSIFLLVALLSWWSRHLRVSSKWIAFLSTSIAVVGILNFAAAIVLDSKPRPIGDDHVHRLPFPYIEFKGSAASGKHNQLGYGGPVPDETKRDGEYRIIFIGGSTVRFGYPPIPAIVEELFHTAGFDDVRVFNFGVSGANTSMDLARLVFEVPAYQPDMIVSYAGGNDINLPVSSDPRPGYPFNYMVTERHPLIAWDYPDLALAGTKIPLMRLFGNKYLLRKLTRVTELRREHDWFTPPWRSRISDIYVQNMEKSATFSEAIDSRFVSVLQPSLLTKQTPSSEEQRYLDILSRVSEKSYQLSLENWRSHDHQIRTELGKALKASDSPNLDFVDLSGIFDSAKETTFRDLVHINQDANAEIAFKLFESLRALRARQ
jgi:lysophospholipase L1-like esterase